MVRLVVWWAVVPVVSSSVVVVVVVVRHLGLDGHWISLRACRSPNCGWMAVVVAFAFVVGECEAGCVVGVWVSLWVVEWRLVQQVAVGCVRQRLPGQWCQHPVGTYCQVVRGGLGRMWPGLRRRRLRCVLVVVVGGS